MVLQRAHSAASALLRALLFRPRPVAPLPPVSPPWGFEAAGCSAPAPLTAEDGDVDASSRGGALGFLEALTQSIWMAVPKRKKSYSRKRQRQMNPLNAAKNVQNFYPCPKCEKGLVKLRHHLCPCDQSKINVASVMKISYARAPTDEAAPAAADDAPASKG